MNWWVVIYLVGVLCFGIGAWSTFRGRCDNKVLFVEALFVLLWPVVAPVVLVLTLVEKRK